MKKSVTDQGCQKRLSKFNGIVNRMNENQLDDELRKRQLPTRFSTRERMSVIMFHLMILFFIEISGSIEIRRVRLKHFYKGQLLLGLENPFSSIEQDFEYIAVVDFEATCDYNQGNSFPHEIIEFPIVLIHVPKRAIVRNYFLLLIKKDKSIPIVMKNVRHYFRLININRFVDLY